MMTNIWSCMMRAHADLGTNNTGNIQCKQYILHQMVALLTEKMTVPQILSSQEMYHCRPVMSLQKCSDEYHLLSFSQ